MIVKVNSVVITGQLWIQYLVLDILKKMGLWWQYMSHAQIQTP